MQIDYFALARWLFLLLLTYLVWQLYRVAVDDRKPGRRRAGRVTPVAARPANEFASPAAATSVAPLVAATTPVAATLTPVGGGSGVRIGAEGLTIGRNPECGLVIASPGVSRHHADVQWRNGSFVVVDQNSANGTSVNGRPVQTSALRDGDRIGFGPVAYVFRVG